MNKFVVTTTRIPTNFNAPTCNVVEAETEQGALLIIKDYYRDFSLPQYVYSVSPYVPPPAGRILNREEL